MGKMEKWGEMGDNGGKCTFPSGALDELCRTGRLEKWKFSDQPTMADFWAGAEACKWELPGALSLWFRISTPRAQGLKVATYPLPSRGLESEEDSKRLHSLCCSGHGQQMPHLQREEAQKGECGK